MISTSVVERRLGVDVDDTLIQELVAAAVAIIGTMTNQYFSTQENTVEYIPGNGTRFLPLRSIPYSGETSDIIAVTEQKAPGSSVAELDQDAADGFELRRLPRSAQLVRAGGYKWLHDYEYKVEFDRGWDVDNLPLDIEQLVIDLVGNRLALVTAGAEGAMKSETIGGYSYTRFDQSDLDAIQGSSDIIAAWKQPVFA